MSELDFNFGEDNTAKDIKKEEEVLENLRDISYKKIGFKDLIIHLTILIFFLVYLIPLIILDLKPADELEEYFDESSINLTNEVLDIDKIKAAKLYENHLRIKDQLKRIGVDARINPYLLGDEDPFTVDGEGR